MSRVYVDSSALVKRVVIEPESPAVVATLAEHEAAGDLLFSSALAWVELARVLRRAGVDQTDLPVAAATAGIAELPLSPTVVYAARAVGTDLLRTLDTIHLAAALSLAASAVLTYDVRLAAAAESAGIAVLAPTSP